MGTEDKSFKASRLLYIFLPLFMLVWLFLWYAIKPGTTGKDKEEIVRKEALPRISSSQPLAENSPKDIKALTTVIFGNNNLLSQRVRALQNLSLLKDESVMSVLIAISRGEAGKDLAVFAQQEIINHLRAAGMNISANYVQNVLYNKQNLGNEKGVDPLLYFVFGVVDYLAPFEKRKAELLEIKSTNTMIATELAAILSYEGSDKEKGLFKALLIRFLGLGDDAIDRPLISIILSEKYLWPLFDRELIQNLTPLSTADVLYGLEKLTSENNALTQALAAELKKRNYFNAMDLVFVDELLSLNAATTPKNVVVALSHGALRKVNKEDVWALAQWQSINAVRPLFAICMNTPDSNLALEAFDSLIPRSSYGNMLIELFGLIKSRYWKDRGKFVRTIGIIGLLDIASDQDVEEAANALLSLTDSGPLLKLVARSDDSRLTLKLLEKVGKITSSDILLDFIKHNDKQIRLVVVRSLSGRSDLVIRHQINKQYRNEQDPEVRAVYEVSHPWLVNNQ